MSRTILEFSKIHPSIQDKIINNQIDTLNEVIQSIENNDIVVIGMGQNPFCKKAQKSLSKAQKEFTYLQYGNYIKEWRKRNIIKMWTGWPTFPMVFVKGTLVGGANEIQSLIEKGELDSMLS